MGDDAVAPRGERLALLGEVLLTGAVLAVLSIPVVTAVPALAAGAHHLDRHVEHRADSVPDLLRLAVRAMRELWLLGVAVPALLLLLAMDLWLVRVVDLPGGTAVGVVTAVAAVAVVVVVLRFAGAWQPGTRVADGVRRAGRRAAGDLTGSVLLVAAVVMVAVVVWMLVPLLLIVPGLLALAALAVERRAAHPRPDQES